MPHLEKAAPERMADNFTAYLFQHYTGNRHVRRVASWIGFVVLGIAKLCGPEWKVPRSRQLRFSYGSDSYKARYSHKVKPRGGIEIIEIRPGRGAPEGRVVVQIGSLAEAEAFYNDPYIRF
jgi:hypothetical protein